MMGATEVLALTCAVILEEGFARADLERIQRSMRATCREAGATVVTGDTKVMGKGELDGIVINTTGVGADASAWCRDCGPAPRRPDPRDRHDRRSRAGGHGGAPRPGARGRPALRRRAAQRPRSRGARGRRRRHRRDEGPDARRPRQRAARDGREERRRHRARRADACR